MYRTTSALAISSTEIISQQIYAGTRLFSLADSVRTIGSGRFGQAVSDWAVSVTGHFGLALSVWGHFGRNISVHKQAIIFVYLNDYIGDIGG